MPRSGIGDSFFLFLLFLSPFLLPLLLLFSCFLFSTFFPASHAIRPAKKAGPGKAARKSSRLKK